MVFHVGVMVAYTLHKKYFSAMLDNQYMYETLTFTASLLAVNNARSYFPIFDHWGWNVAFAKVTCFSFIVFFANLTADAIVFAIRHVTQYFVCVTHIEISKYVRVSAVLVQYFVGIKNGKILKSWTGYYCLLFVIQKGVHIFCSYLINALNLALCGLCSLEHTDGISISCSVHQRTDSLNCG